MNCRRSLGNRDRGFESHSGHGCLICVCAFFCICVQVEALRRADHPTECVRSRKTEVNGEVHGGRPRPTGAVVPRGKKDVIGSDRDPVASVICANLFGGPKENRKTLQSG
jgi:hypothetical protein